MDLRQSGGSIRAGRYHTITAGGGTAVESGVLFGTLIVTGPVNAASCSGGAIDCRSGTLHCSGDMQVHALRGHGTIVVDGDLICDVVRFVGVIDVRGGIQCRTQLEVHGRLSGCGLVEADGIEVEGTLHADELHATRLRIGPLRALMFARPAMPDFATPSRVRTVDGDTVTLTTDDGNFVHHFAVEDGALVYQAKDSTDFMYLTVSDGEKFLPSGASIGSLVTDEG